MPIDAAPKIVQYLSEAHATELALVRTLQAHTFMTPRGDYRVLLERHLEETRRQARNIERRLGELKQDRNALESSWDSWLGVAQSLLGQALALSRGPLDVLRGSGAEEKLLKNAKDECATEALEIATYDALERLALAGGDEPTARLAADHRAQEERMLADLRALIPVLTDAMLAAEGEEARPVGAVGAARADGEEPWAGYDRHNVAEIRRRLGRASRAQARRVGDYERAHKGRAGVLRAVEGKLK
jgi:ferritin-like metal-binding protein YciE